MRIRGVPVIACVLVLLPASAEAEPFQLRLGVEDAADSLEVDTIVAAGELGSTSAQIWRGSTAGRAVGAAIMVIGALTATLGVVGLSYPDDSPFGDLADLGVALGGVVLILIGGLVALWA